MIGAVIVTPMTRDVVMALIPLVVGVLSAFVTYGRCAAALTHMVP